MSFIGSPPGCLSLVQVAYLTNQEGTRHVINNLDRTPTVISMQVCKSLDIIVNLFSFCRPPIAVFRTRNEDTSGWLSYLTIAFYDWSYSLVRLAHLITITTHATQAAAQTDPRSPTDPSDPEIARC
jgi:hypothetical protein